MASINYKIELAKKRYEEDRILHPYKMMVREVLLEVGFIYTINNFTRVYEFNNEFLRRYASDCMKKGLTRENIYEGCLKTMEKIILANAKMRIAKEKIATAKKQMEKRIREKMEVLKKK